MLIRYLYAANRQLVGCVVRTDEGRLGYSAVHPRDRRKLTKKLARRIAEGRAEKCDVVLGPPGDEHWWRGRGKGWQLVPARVEPVLVMLSAPKPKPSISADDIRSMSPEDIRRWRAGSWPKS